MSDRDMLNEAENAARVATIGCHARGDYDGERRWLDLLPLLADAKEERARLIADAEARGAARGRNEAREAVVTYCDLSAQFAAEASPDNLAAAGLARAYRDVADKLRAALTTGDPA